MVLLNIVLGRILVLVLFGCCCVCCVFLCLVGVWFVLLVCWCLLIGMFLFDRVLVYGGWWVCGGSCGRRLGCCGCLCG